MGRRRSAPEPERYAIEFTRAAERGLAALPKHVLQRMDAAIGALAEEPRPPGSKKLRGGEGLSRIRVDDYRAIYRVDDDRRVVLMIDVGNRKDIYGP
jgi:mRNA interferase RelE/StbE